MSGKFILTVFAAMALLVQTTTAVTYTVGDALGWNVPPTPQTYPDWASRITFRVGDILVFNFAAGAHDVATVTTEAYGSCNTNSPLTMQTVGPVAFSLDNAGEINFICTFGAHCSLGQKFTINVTAAAPSPPSVTPTTPAPTSPAPAAPSPPSVTPTTPAPTSPAPGTPTTPAPASPAPGTPTAPAPASPSPTQVPGVPTGSPAGSPPNPTIIPPPGSSAPPPDTTTTTPTPPGMAPPPPSSATRTMTVVGFMGTMMAIAMGFTL